MLQVKPNKPPPAVKSLSAVLASCKFDDLSLALEGAAAQVFVAQAALESCDAIIQKDAAMALWTTHRTLRVAIDNFDQAHKDLCALARSQKQKRSDDDEC